MRAIVVSSATVPVEPTVRWNETAPAIETIAVLGVDYRSAPLAIREALAVPAAILPQALERLRLIAREGFIVSTCNRTEIYAMLDTPDREACLRSFLADLHELPRAQVAAVSYVKSGPAAIDQLFAVAGGLNSMMLGEPHILTQVRIALDAAREAGTLGPVLSRAGEAALRVGKRTRTETGITRNGNSIPHATARRIETQLGDLAGRTIVIAGAGQMAGHTARLLRSAGADQLVILNRTPLHAEALAHAVNARSGPLTELVDELKQADAVVSAVSIAEGFLLDAATLAGRDAPLLVVDLGVPRTVDPALRADPRVQLIDIDDLGHETPDAPPSRAADIAAMQAMVAEELDRFAAWSEERAVAATITSLRDRAEQIRQAELDRALRRLGTLSDREREIVAALSVGLVGKLLHEPVMRLKADRAGLDQAVQTLFGLQPEPASPVIRGE